MITRETRLKARKKKEEEKTTTGTMLRNSYDKKVRDADVLRQNRNVALPETQKYVAQKNRRKIVIVDKHKRVGELSKLCSELKKGKVGVKREKKKTRSKKERMGGIGNNVDLLPYRDYDNHAKSSKLQESPMTKRTPYGGARASLQLRHKKKKDTPLKYVNQNVDITSLNTRKQKDKVKKKNSSRDKSMDDKSRQKMAKNPNASDKIGAFDMSDLKRSVSLIAEARAAVQDKHQRKKKSKRKKKTKKVKNPASTQMEEESKDIFTPLTPTLPFNDSQSTKRPMSVQSKRNLFEGVFVHKKERSPIKDEVGEISTTPRTLKRGFVALNTVSPAVQKTPLSRGQKPPKRIMDNSQHDKGRAEGYINSAIALLSNKSYGDEVRILVNKIDEAGGFPITRRLSLRDNELVGNLTMAIRNDPRITSIEVCPSLFGTISSTLLEDFIRALRINLHLKSLTFSGVELGNDFLYSLASSMESNFVIEEIDLSRNLFTNAGLAEFCQVIASSNDTCRILNLENQTTPISKASEEDVLEAFQQNRAIQEIKLDFQSEKAADKLADIVNRNKTDCPLKTSKDEKLLNVLRYEAERAQELLEEQNEGDLIHDIGKSDWDHLYQLSIQFDKHKLKKHIQETSGDFVPATRRRNSDSMTKEEKKNFLFGEFRKNLGESVTCFNSDGSFLTAEFIAKYFVEDNESSALTFDFHGQWKLFRRFPVHDPARKVIVSKFVDAIVTHPRADKITSINMANTGCGDDFLVDLSNRCLNDVSLLPSLLILNFETNFINVDGVSALAKVIGSPTSLKFLQVVRLENQKFLLKSKAELALARAMRVNFSVVVVSLRIRNLMERQQISKYVLRNVELIRQARQRHFKVTGQQRDRNEVEKFFDRIAENDSSIDEVDLVGNKRFLTLTPEEKTKAAKSFAQNTNVKTLNLNSCGIDDEFAIALASALKQNKVIGRVFLEGNDISGAGITALFEALAVNSSIEEMKLHKQSKTMHTSEEHKLADILLPNTALTKMGIDLRTTMAQVMLDKKLNLNRNTQLKLRAKAKGERFQSSEGFSTIKF